MEGLIAILGLASIGVMIWGIVFAVRRIRQWDRSVTVGTLIRFGAGLVVFIVALALTPTVDGNDDNVSDSPPSSTTSQPVSATSESPAPTPPEGAPKQVPADVQKATIRKIVDGDTVELAATTKGPALSTTQQVEVRLLEIDTPETQHPSKPVQCYGKKATEHLRELAPVDSTVWVQRDDELKDQYDRHLLYLWADDGTFVNLNMVANGFAKATLYQPNDKHWDRINEAGQKARTQNTGLWGACDYFGQPVNTPKPEQEPEPEPNPNPNPNPQPQPQPQPEPEPEPEPEPNCASGYSPCVPPYPPDVNCSDVNGPIRVTGSDPHNLDADGDGVGCEG